MALQAFVCGFTLMTMLLCTGYHAEQPACGRAVINSRIIGGEDAAPGRWPWFAAIRYEGEDICGGSLINNQWVLTSAHCTYHHYVSGAVVHLGVHNRSETNPGEVTRGVDAIVCHPGFKYYTHDNDICLLKLSAPVNFTDYIQPVCLASANSTFYDGITSWVTGFGYTDYYYYYYYQPDILQEARVSIVGNNRCNCTFDTHYSLTENMMCAGFKDGRNRTEWGDSGVPLVTKRGSVWLQTGIKNSLLFYYPPSYSVFTRVSQYEKWINDKISGMKPGFVTFTSPGNNSDLNFTCPTQPPPIPFHTIPFNTTFYTPTTFTTVNTTDKDDSIFGGAENQIHFAHFLSLFASALLFHVFLGSG